MGAAKRKNAAASVNGQPRQLLKLATTLFPNAQERESFVEALVQGVSGVPAIIWTMPKLSIDEQNNSMRSRWHPEFIDVLKKESQPGSTRLHEEGYYYCLDNSSLFEASIISQIRESCQYIADVCAAPGGKSIFSWRLFSPKFLLCNEAIRSRIPVLISNLKRCQVKPVYISGFDSERLKTAFPSSFDLVLVDAPCSGQSLLARGADAKGCFNPRVINMNSNRQKRILANSAALVREGGYLAYMTCTFSIEENEKVLSWFLKKFKNFSMLEAPLLARHASKHADFPCYRLWPQEGLGAGGFTALLRCDHGHARREIDIGAWKFLWQADGK